MPATGPAGCCDADHVMSMFVYLSGAGLAGECEPAPAGVVILVVPGEPCRIKFGRVIARNGAWDERVADGTTLHCLLVVALTLTCHSPEPW